MQPPETVLAGSVFEVFVVTLDFFGNRTSDTGRAVILMLVGSPEVVLSGTTTVQAVSGLVPIARLSIDTPGTYSLSVFHGNAELEPAFSQTFAVLASNPT